MQEMARKNEDARASGRCIHPSLLVIILKRREGRTLSDSQGHVQIPDRGLEMHLTFRPLLTAVRHLSFRSCRRDRVDAKANT